MATEPKSRRRRRKKILRKTDGSLFDATERRRITPAELRAFLEQGTLLKRLPTLAELADTAAFVASDRAGAMTATVVNLSAGSFAD